LRLNVADINRPRPLQLTAGDEIVAVENLDILRSNGFEVEIDEDQIPGRGERIKLSAMPVSKETTFDFKGKHLLTIRFQCATLIADLEQLLHLLSDGSRPAGQMVRCTKARAMFAMRACRKSVMIGKTLTKNQMVALLRNMGTIDQPWVCLLLLRDNEGLMSRIVHMVDRLCDI
jgi:DNA mismatch repair protein PMS2